MKRGLLCIVMAVALVCTITVASAANSNNTTTIQGNSGKTNVVFDADSAMASYTVTIPSTVSLSLGGTTSAYVYADNVFIEKNKTLTVSLQPTFDTPNYTVYNGEGDSVSYTITYHKNIPLAQNGTPQTPDHSEAQIITATSGATILEVDPYSTENGGKCAVGTYKETDGLGYQAASELVFYGPAAQDILQSGTYAGTVTFHVALVEDVP